MISRTEDSTIMKKKYAKPEIEITAFTTEDIITASTGMERVEDVITPGFSIDVSDEKDWKNP